MPSDMNASTVMTDAMGRYPYLDLAKGIAVVLMVQVHLMEVFASPGVFHSLIGRVSLFLGGPLVAPVFLGVLGFFIARKRYGARELLVRGGKLLTVGLALNVGLNAHLLYRVYVVGLDANTLEFLFGVDILFSAGLSLIVLAALRLLLRSGYLEYLLLGGLVAWVAPWVSTALVVDSNLKYLLAFIAGGYEWSYFPVFPWLAYPLLGYGLGLAGAGIGVGSDGARAFEKAGNCVVVRGCVRVGPGDGSRYR